jgi:Ulp1 family protease
MRHLKEQPNYVIAKIGKEIHVTTESLKSLQHINWLHADIVDFYAILLNDRYRITSNPTVKYHVMSNAEMQRIMKNGTPDTVVGMAKKQIDPFSFEILLFFTYLEDRKHWILCIADHRAGTLVCLDSQLPKTNQETSEHDKLEAIQQYLDIEHLRRKGCKTKRYKKETKLDIPQQIGGNDCGVFMCAFAEQICRGAPLNFSQEGVKERRLLMTYEVIVGHIL